MNIYGHIRQAVRELEPIFAEDKPIHPQQTILHLKHSWALLEKYFKNINGPWTLWFDDFLQNVDAAELWITEDMRDEAAQIYERLADERDVKTFVWGYIRLVEMLLVFSRPLEDCCRVCQGGLEYVTLLDCGTVISRCRTCSACFAGSSEKLIEARGAAVRSAKRSELEPLFAGSKQTQRPGWLARWLGKS